jgi:hypothetical protein
MLFILSHHQDRLYAFAFRLAESSQDAEDVVQEALLGAYVTLLHYPTARIRMLKLRAWLYKITLKGNAVRAAVPLGLPLPAGVWGHLCLWAQAQSLYSMSLANRVY